ncbi:hypothetical protein FPV67DRAFT_194332 [Lyophyllum atratum]|nr:hypothetical protein FPV67DRAFT_194332 [Lyophyllum atratum]
MASIVLGPVSTLGYISFLTIPALLGNMISYILFGVLLAQVYLYHTHFPHDQQFIKCIVYGVFVFDIFILVLSNVVGWAALSAGWADFSMLPKLSWAFTILPCLTGFLSSCVRLFFCWRMWVLRGLYIIPGCVLAMSVATWGVATFCGVYASQLGIAQIHVLRPFIGVWLGCSFLCDLLVTVTMVYILFPLRSKPVLGKRASLAGNLSRLTVETGMIACVVALVEAILFLGCPQNYLYFVPFFFLSTLYANTLLATLNSRSLLAGAPCARKPSLSLWDNRPPTSDYLTTGQSARQSALDTDSFGDPASASPYTDYKSPSHSLSFPAAYFPA